MSKEADEWFTTMLAFKCRLVYMPESTNLLVDTDYANHQEINSLSDGYPFLVIGQSSLDYLNAKLSDPLPINRFRPNMVICGGDAHDEDLLEHLPLTK